MIFQNRTALVTGAAGMIGSCICRTLGKLGVTIIQTDLSEERLAETEKALKEENIKVFSVPMDITDPGAVCKAAEKIHAEFGHVDILINNAGYVRLLRFTETSEEEWTKIIDTNLNGFFRVTRAFLDDMLQQNYGRIINIGSIAGEVGLPGATAYSASKGGVILFTKTLAMEVAKKNITVNCISPGMIGRTSAKTDSTWVGWNGTGNEIARAIAFLASDDAGYITGVDMPVDGGRILGPCSCHFE